MSPVLHRAKLSAATLGVVTFLGLGGCYSLSGDVCRVHCWEHRPLIEDQDQDHKFDLDCENGGASPLRFDPPLPPAGFFIARACTDSQAQHNTLKAAIAAILGSESLNANQLSTYQDIVDDIADAGVEQCVAHLIGDDLSTQVTEYTDIDPGIPGIQSCVLADAQALCDIYVRAAIHDELDEVLGGGDQVPQLSTPGSQILQGSQSCDYVPELGQGDTDTATSGGEGEGGGGGGGDDSATSGVDSSGSSGSGAVGPWGDLPSLVSCNANNICTVDRVLIDNVTASFATLYDDGVLLSLVTSPAKGVRLTGVDRGEDSADLIDAFGVQDDDIITEIDGITLDSEAAMDAALASLSPIPSPVQFTVVRKVGAVKTTLNFEVRFID
jgi:hypothetical protein